MMKNIIILQKEEDGNVSYRQVTELAIDYVKENNFIDPSHLPEYWEKWVTIPFEDLGEVLDKEIKDYKKND